MSYPRNLSVVNPLIPGVFLMPLLPDLSIRPFRLQSRQELILHTFSADTETNQTIP
jgi:hypothetical protein